MKSKFSKRILSVFLAALMVITSVPAFAFNAFAAGEGKENLETAISDFETKFDGKHVYTNMYNAYRAYAQAKDALMHSNQDDYLQERADILNDYSGKMAEWKPFTAAGKVYYGEDEATGGYENVVYSEPAGSDNILDTYPGSGGVGLQGTTTTAKLFSVKNTVMIYDNSGNKPGFPIVMQGRVPTAGWSLKIYSLYSNTANLDFADVWHSNETDYNRWNPTSTRTFSSTNGTNSNTDIGGTNANYTYSNKCVYNGSVNTDTYYEEFTDISLILTGKLSRTFSSDKTVNDELKTGASHQYIINYKALDDEIQAFEKYLDFEKYSSMSDGKRTALMKAFDMATSIDPSNTNAYDYSKNAAQAVQDCASDIKKAIEALRSYDAETINNFDYESAGDIVTFDDVIYTHKANNDYTLYGNEISDNINYGNGNDFGERVTKITTSYPYYIDTNDKYAVYCISDDYLDIPYVGGNYTAVPVNADNDKWYGPDGQWHSGTDVAAIARNDKNAASQYKKVYYLTGNVSDAFGYNEEAKAYVNNSQYAQGIRDYSANGLEFLVKYKNSLPEVYPNPEGYDLDEFSEFEFAYVTSNPGIAHQLLAIRNESRYDYTTDAMDRRASYTLFSRFPGSEGSASTINSELVKTHDRATDSSQNYNNDKIPTEYWGNGNYNWLSSFGTGDSVAEGGYDTALKIFNSFNFYESKEGVASGSFGIIEHRDQQPISYAVASNVVDTDYYIDYSNPNDSLITRNANGVPTGYSFDMLVSNLYWQTKDGVNVAAGTSYYKNNTGLNVAFAPSGEWDYTQSDGRYINVKDTSKGPDYGNGTGWSNVDMLDYGRDPDKNENSLRNVLRDSGTTGNNGLHRGFDFVDSGVSKTNNYWTGKVTFTGKSSLVKNTDTSSAENYANFILEQGNYNHVNHIGGSDWYLGQETYHYYNIGVSTCDKGATREFAQTFLNKKLAVDSDGNVILDEDGRPTAVGDMETGDYSVPSYKEYLDAVGKLFWFVQNEHNTTYDGGKEYTTAYNADGKPILVTDNSGSDIFADAQTNTDPVQAQLIQDVIDAYNNLFVKDDYTETEKTYNDALELFAEIPEDKYTSETYSNYEDLLTYASQYYSYYDTKNQPVDGEEYWRYTSLTGSEYRELESIITELEGALMPRADRTGDEVEGSGLIPLCGTKQIILNNGIYENNKQTKTLASWKALEEELTTAQGVLVDTQDVARYATEETKTVSFLGRDFTYSPVPENPTYSQEQLDVIAEVEKLNLMDLADVDADERYDAFDASYEVVTTLERNKYTDAGLAKLDALTAQLGKGEISDTITDEKLAGKSVYASADDVANYNAVTGANLSADTKIKVTGLNETDTLTAALLELVNELNADYVKKFKSELTVQVDGVPVGEVVRDVKDYGEMFTLDAQKVLEDAGYNVDANTVVNWSATLYDGTAEVVFNNADPIGSQKVSSYYGTTLLRKADSNVALVANFTEGSKIDTVTVKIYDVYGALIDVKYVDSQLLPDPGPLPEVSINGETINHKTIPFYNFMGWTVSEVDDDNVVTVKPIYTKDRMCDISVPENATVNGKTDLARVKYDTTVSLDGRKIDNFYAWAVKTADDNYQIASYNADYQFYAVGKETYVAVTSADGKTFEIEGKPVTADMIENALPENKLAVDADTFVNQKLEKKAPFVSIQETTMYDNNTRARVYVRVTEGSAEQLTGYGIVYKPGAETNADSFVMGGNGVYSRNIDNILPTGQYVVSLVKSTGFTKDVSFRAFITYDFTYSFKGVDTEGYETIDESSEINAIDYSEIAVAKRV